MKSTRVALVALVGLGLSVGAIAGEGLSRAEYEKQFTMVSGDVGQRADVDKCLAAWGDDAPFAADTTFRVMSSSVRVAGFGKEPTDDVVSTDPVLIYIEPNVNVAGGTTYRLLNPNGWYCFNSSVSVLGTTTYEVACSAHMADASSGTEVLGENTGDKGGVTVGASSQVNRVGCE